MIVHEPAPVLSVGDIFQHGGDEFIVTYVNQSRAHCLPTSTKINRLIPETGCNAGKEVEFHSRGRAIDISPNSEVQLTRRGGQKAVTDFLSGIKAANRREQTISGEESNDTMKTRNKPIRTPRGGLAAESKATKATKKAKGERKQGKCGLIDDLLEKGTYTKAQILDKVCEKFDIPKSKRDSTMSTINARPSHMKAAGRKASWIDETPEKPEAKKEEKKEEAAAAA